MKTLSQAYAEGMEAFAKHCLRYGRIRQDTDWQSNGNHYRDFVIDISDMVACIEKCNGSVTRTEYYIIE